MHFIINILRYLHKLNPLVATERLGNNSYILGNNGYTFGKKNAPAGSISLRKTGRKQQNGPRKVGSSQWVDIMGNAISGMMEQTDCVIKNGMLFFCRHLFFCSRRPVCRPSLFFCPHRLAVQEYSYCMKIAFGQFLTACLHCPAVLVPFGYLLSLHSF